MSSSIYTAILDSGEEQESVRLEFVDGEPQRELVRTADLDGDEVEITRVLDPDSAGYVYRPFSLDE